MSTGGEGEHEAEGVRAFLKLSAAIERLDWRLNTHEEAQQRLLREQQGVVESTATVLNKAQEAADTVVEAMHSTRAVIVAWGALAATLGVLSGVTGGYHFGQKAGFVEGHAQGTQEARDTQAAASWANTPTGRLARKLDEAGSLTTVANCTNPGWRRERKSGGTYCFVYPAPNGDNYGWAVP